MSAYDTQVGGDHYRLPIQPAHFIHQNALGFFAGCIIKYAVRAGKKGSREHHIQDLKKIIHYAEMWIEELSSE